MAGAWASWYAALVCALRLTSEGAPHRNDPRALLVRAQQTLEPIALELGPERLRIDAYVDGIDADGAVLSALPAELHDAATERTRILGMGDEPWCIAAGRCEHHGDRFVRLRWDGMRVEACTSGDLRLATDLLVLVVPGGLPGANAYVFPVVQIGAHACEIRASVALPPGHTLERVEILGDRRLLRSASAQVLETRPWYASGGRLAFGTRIALHDLQEHDVATSDRDLVTTAAEVARLLKLASMGRAAGSFEVPGGPRGALCVSALAKSEVSFDLARTPMQSMVGEAVRVAIDLFATGYELDVRVLSQTENTIQTTLPLILRRSRTPRREQRVPVGPSHAVELRFRNPVTGAVQAFGVTEVSYATIAASCRTLGTVLWRGLPLEQAQLTFGERVIALGDVVVDSIEITDDPGCARCIVSLQSSSVAEDPDMILLMASLAHPDVRVHDGRAFSAMHAMYVRAGLFGPHMHRNLEPILEQTSDVWHRLHSGAADVTRTFVFGTGPQPEAAVTVMRAWEHAWVLQHFVDTSGERSGATGRLQSAYLDHLVPRPDARYLLFFVKTDNHIMNAYLRRFFESTGTPEAILRTDVELWIGRRRDAVSAWPSSMTLRPMTVEDDRLVQRAAVRWFGAEAAAALSFSPDERTLPDTGARFARAGLERSRRCEIVEDAGNPLYALIEECTTPGANLTWMLNATWILPLRSSLDPHCRVLGAALRAILGRTPQSATGEFFLNLPAGLPEAVLTEAGFAREAALYLYVLNRAGLHRFFHYAAERYGELDVISQKRKKRTRDEA